MSTGTVDYRGAHTDWMMGYQRTYGLNSTSNSSIHDEVNNTSSEAVGCVDGSNDGKIGFWEGVKSVFGGIGNAIGNTVKGVANLFTPSGIKSLFTNSEGKFSLFKPLLIAGSIAACVAFPVAAPLALGAVGAVMGGAQVIKGVSALGDCKTDAEKREALANIGAGSFEVVLSVADITGTTKAMKAASVAGKIGDVTKTVDKIGDLAKISDNIDDASDVVKFIDNADDATGVFKKLFNGIDDIQDSQGLLKNLAKSDTPVDDILKVMKENGIKTSALDNLDIAADASKGSKAWQKTKAYAQDLASSTGQNWKTIKIKHSQSRANHVKTGEQIKDLRKQIDEIGEATDDAAKTQKAALQSQLDEVTSGTTWGKIKGEMKADWEYLKARGKKTGANSPFGSKKDYLKAVDDLDAAKVTAKNADEALDVAKRNLNDTVEAGKKAGKKSRRIGETTKAQRDAVTDATKAQADARKAVDTAEEAVNGSKFLEAQRNLDDAFGNTAFGKLTAKSQTLQTIREQMATIGTQKGLFSKAMKMMDPTTYTNILSKLPTDLKAVWEYLGSADATFSKAARLYGYDNARQIVTIMANNGIVFENIVQG